VRFWLKVAVVLCLFAATAGTVHVRFVSIENRVAKGTQAVGMIGGVELRPHRLNVQWASFTLTFQRVFAVRIHRRPGRLIAATAAARTSTDHVRNRVHG
jgi:hypothetical protein